MAARTSPAMALPPLGSVPSRSMNRSSSGSGSKATMGTS
jgi:hypothetical protein